MVEKLGFINKTCITSLDSEDDVWRLSEFKDIKAGGGEINGMAALPDNRLLTSGMTAPLELWGPFTKTNGCENIRHISESSRRGKLLAVSGNGTIAQITAFGELVVGDPDAEAPSAVIQLDDYDSQRNDIRAMVFYDSQRNDIRAMVFVSTKLIAIAYSSHVEVWDIEAKKHVRDIRFNNPSDSHLQKITAITLMSNGMLACAVGVQNNASRIYLCNPAEDWEERFLLDTPEIKDDYGFLELSAVVELPYSRIAAIAGNKLYILNLKSGSSLRLSEQDESVRHIAVTHDFFLVSDYSKCETVNGISHTRGGLRIMNPYSYAKPGSIGRFGYFMYPDCLHSFEERDSVVTGLAVLPDGRIVSAYEDGWMRIWNDPLGEDDTGAVKEENLCWIKCGDERYLAHLDGDWRGPVITLKLMVGSRNALHKAERRNCEISAVRIIDPEDHKLRFLIRLTDWNVSKYMDCTAKTARILEAYTADVSRESICNTIVGMLAPMSDYKIVRRWALSNHWNHFFRTDTSWIGTEHYRIEVTKTGTRYSIAVTAFAKEGKEASCLNHDLREADVPQALLNIARSMYRRHYKEQKLKKEEME